MVDSEPTMDARDYKRQNGRAYKIALTKAIKSDPSLASQDKVALRKLKEVSNRDDLIAALAEGRVSELFQIPDNADQTQLKAHLDVVGDTLRKLINLPTGRIMSVYTAAENAATIVDASLSDPQLWASVRRYGGGNEVSSSSTSKPAASAAGASASAAGVSAANSATSTPTVDAPFSGFDSSQSSPPDMTFGEGFDGTTPPTLPPDIPDLLAGDEPPPIPGPSTDTSQISGFESWNQPIPPATPTGASAQSEPDNRVMLSWTSNEPDCQFDIRRTVDRPATSVNEGTRVYLGPETAVADAHPEYGRTLYYAIFALNHDSLPSPPAYCSCRVLPSPTNVTIEGEKGDITLSWQRPGGAVATEIELSSVNGSGRHTEESEQTLSIDGLELGTTYTFRLFARYIDSGEALFSAPVEKSYTPKGEAAAPEKLQVSVATNDEGSSTASAQWNPPLGYDVELWQFPVGTFVPTDSDYASQELIALGGQVLTGRMSSVPTGQTMTFECDGKMHTYVAATVLGDRRIPSSSVSAGELSPPDGVECQRLGDELLISLKWPSPQCIVRVEQRGQQGVIASNTVEQGAYRLGGGIRVPASDELTEVRISTVLTLGRHHYESEPHVMAVERPASRVAYTMHIKRVLRRPTKVSITVCSENHAGPVRLDVGYCVSRFLPQSMSECQSLGVIETILAPGQTYEVTLPISGGQKDSWIRLFPTAGSNVVVLDPPTSSMKG